MKKGFKRIGYGLLAVFLLMNAVAFMHAYSLTHFSSAEGKRTPGPGELTFSERMKVLFTGATNPRPVNKTQPSRPFETVLLQSNKTIECWYMKAQEPKGTVILFHGYGSKKSALVPKSDAFLQMGYNTLLVDFMGSGASEGNRTTIGFREAEQVRSCYGYVHSKGENNIVLFGGSMGAVAIMKAVKDHGLQPSALILECPFKSMQDAVDARFQNMKIPTFPMAPLLVFWGGIQNGFWAFGHKPVEYAKSIHIPTLLLYGEKDDRVRRHEIDGIYENLAGEKQLITYPSEGHSIQLGALWVKDVNAFVNQKR